MYVGYSRNEANIIAKRVHLGKSYKQISDELVGNLEFATMRMKKITSAISKYGVCASELADSFKRFWEAANVET